MNFHYALVDDLISRQEFEKRVEEKMEACGAMVDEVAASLMVVQDLGRHHVKMKDLSHRTSLFSFFGKVITLEGPREFDREGGEKGLVATMVLGDETGHVRVTLWDEKAMAVSEISAGDVFEVIGKHSKPSSRDITALAFRPSPVEITCRETAAEVRQEFIASAEIVVRVLVIRGERPYIRKGDGSTGVVREALVTDGVTTMRLTCWEPGLLDGIVPMALVRVTGAALRITGSEKEVVIGEHSAVLEYQGEDIPLPLVQMDAICDGGVFSVRGTITGLQPVRRFTQRDGTASTVRNLTLTDGSASLAVVIWGVEAITPLLSGEEIFVWNARAGRTRQGFRELSVGRGGGITVIPGEKRSIRFTGTVLATPGGIFIDDGTKRYLLASPLEDGLEFEVEGVAAGCRFLSQTARTVVPDPGPVKTGLEEVAGRAERRAVGSLSHRTA